MSASCAGHAITVISAASHRSTQPRNAFEIRLRPPRIGRLHLQIGRRHDAEEQGRRGAEKEPRPAEGGRAHDAQAVQQRHDAGRHAIGHRVRLPGAALLRRRAARRAFGEFERLLAKAGERREAEADDLAFFHDGGIEPAGVQPAAQCAQWRRDGFIGCCSGHGDNLERFDGDWNRGLRPPLLRGGARGKAGKSWGRCAIPPRPPVNSLVGDADCHRVWGSAHRSCPT